MRQGIFEFSESGPKVEYSSRFAEEGLALSSYVPMHVNEITEVEQAYLQLGDRGGPLTREAVINNSVIANYTMTFSEFYLASKLVKQSEA